MIKIKHLLSAISATIILTGCSAHSAKTGASGAAMGAAGASVVGALTDLILTGSVNPSTLARNAVSGGIAGGAAGTYYGYSQEKDAKKAKNSKEALSNEKLKKEIGSNNMQALQKLFECKHKEAYSITLNSTSSSNMDYKLSGVAIQALIDKDRGNGSGVERSIEKYMSLDNKIKTKEQANQELDALYKKVIQEREVEGLALKCTQ
ncbi:MAG: hypothetical protein U9N42_04075 [Campylobacterota bacterium]|nr:hypothetical protein [Campylobacterota bacterium]